VPSRGMNSKKSAAPRPITSNAAIIVTTVFAALGPGGGTLGNADGTGMTGTGAGIG